MELAGARVLDLFAGSGAIGLEALSRGASHALFIEHDLRAGKTLRANVETLSAAGAKIVTGKVINVLGQGNQGEPYDLTFADPPYSLTELDLEAMLTALAGPGGWLSPEAVVVIERSSRSPEPKWVPGITGERGRRYGETTLWYGRAATNDGRLVS